MWRRAFRAGLVLVLACASSPLLGLQTQVFRARVDLVELDVSVLDKNRKPVRGLTKADFTVLEDGKPQEVAVFEAIDVADPIQPPEWMREVSPDVTTNETRVSRLWVIALDDAMIPQVPFAIKASKQIVREIIERLSPDDLATVVLTADSRQAQDFTNDRVKLLATLDKYNPGNAVWMNPDPDTPKRDPDPDWGFRLGALRTLRSIVDAVSDVPHQRKALIWITPGIPHNLAIEPFEVPKLDPNMPLMAYKIQQHRIRELADDIFQSAKRANVPVYPIDPCGLGGIDACLSGLPFVTNRVKNSLDFVLTTARNTGGHAIINTNDFTPGVQSIFEENASYYSVGYYPTNAKPDGTLRRITVKVNRDDVDVRTRSGYFAPKPGDSAPRSAGQRLQRAAAGVVPVSDLPLRATAAPFAIPGSNRTAAVAIALGVRQPVPESAAKARSIVTTELLTNAFTTEGQLKGSQRHSARVTLREGAQGDAEYEALSRIDLPPGRYRLRLAAHHGDAGKTGTVMVDVVVPDFANEPASISGVVLGAVPGRPSAPRELMANVLPLVPSAQRDFTKSDRATALFYLYQNAGRPVLPASVEIRITDNTGAVLIRDPRTIAVDSFRAAEADARAAARSNMPGGKPTPGVAASAPARQASSTVRAAEVQYPLPLERLPIGRYLVTFDVNIGSVRLRRDLQFTVRASGK